MSEVLGKLQNEIDALEKEGVELVEAKNFDKADEVKAKLQAKRAEMKQEILFLEDEKKRSAEAKAKEQEVANKIEKGEVNPMKVEEYNKENHEAENDVQSEQYLDAWAKTMQNQKLTAEEEKVLNSVNVAHNFTHNTDNTALLIPNTVAAGIWARIDELFPLWAAVPKTRVNGTLTYQKYKGHKETKGWYDDDKSRVEATEFQFGQLTLAGCELSKAVEVSFKMTAMSREEFIPFITNRLAQTMGFALSHAVWQGAGVATNRPPEPVGIFTELKANDNEQIKTYTEGALAYTDLTNLMSGIHSPYLGGADIYCSSKTIWNVLANVRDENGRPIFVANPIRGGVGTIFGTVVRAAAEIPENTLLLGNMEAGYRCNINQDISVYPDVKARERYIDYTTYSVVDGGVIDTKAFVVMECEAKAGKRAAASG